MAHRRLIVNADDYNTDPERNRGILEAARRGIVTSVSVLSNLPLRDASREDLIAVFGSRIGIHLNITRGMPLSADAKTLVNGRGFFHAKRAVWAEALRRRLDLREIEQEFTAQIMHLETKGINPDHIDGNNHVHVFPGIAEVVVRTARRFSITRIRLPRESVMPGGSFTARCSLKRCLLQLLSLRARRLFERAGLVFTDFFAGINHPRVSDSASLRVFLKHLPEGTTELMCHPGYPTPENPFSNEERERELASLVDSNVLKDISRYGIELVSYGDLR